MRKRRKFSVKNIILKGFMNMVCIIFMLSAMALDSEHWVSALVVCATSFAILMMYGWVNGAFGGDWDER